ncbi:MAG TPA: SusD/RagB family nutrient-binding outer membrane lipoprotein [Puia sp.]|uniref:SusD/RagB family nutrient-binding outer membrane lipoprotein n=1 Tax=Puia sp. TaxID=2045100 RepID=UPI002C47567F|nr:SusD/RagB family nutrient-binding outer membrane lipoprotein [Puia sp.]HVU96258.1 SusD/RagB family nutrient-binding outer membrane lipoprotein [Puia sp.]
MKKIIAYTAILAVLAGTGCKKFVDVNQDPNNPLSVQEKILLAPIEENIAHGIDAGGSQGNDGEGEAATFTNHFMQTICYNQVALNYGTYFFVGTDMNLSWQQVYNTVLINLKQLTDISQKNGNANYTGIAEILTAYTLGFTTDLWGDIPYSKALGGASNLQPTYDKQESIYDSVQALLDRGIADIGKSAGLKVGADDYFYGGKMSQWVKLAYSLKARYYMHLTKAPGHTAVAQAQLALTALQNGMTSNDDDWKFAYPGGATSQAAWYTIMLPYSTLCASSAIVDTLVARNDPRLPFVITKSRNTGLYTGRPIGTPTIGDLGNYSSFGDYYSAADATQYIMPYTEVQFIQAEANWLVTGVGAAQPFYTAAITNNMTKIGVAAGDITTYLGSRGTLTAGNALQRIIEEKRIAHMLSPENYNDWRRTGWPALTIVPNAQTAGIPRRLIYPQSELNTNPQPQQSAQFTDRVWWDAQ